MLADAMTRPFDVTDHLDNAEEVAAYLDAVLEEGDDKLLLVALRNVVKSRGFAKVAQGAGLRRETLYQSFSEDGNPRLSTLNSVLGQLDLRLSVTPRVKIARAAEVDFQKKPAFRIERTEKTITNGCPPDHESEFTVSVE